MRAFAIWFLQASFPAHIRVFSHVTCEATNFKTNDRNRCALKKVKFFVQPKTNIWTNFVVQKIAVILEAIKRFFDLI